MAIVTGAGIKFMEELPLGIHTLAEGVPDTIMVALYGPNASIGPGTDAYTPVGEVVGSGYVAGGVVLANGLIVVGASGSSRAGAAQFNATPYINPVDDLTINIQNVAVRGCLMYNLSQGNRVIFSLDFGDTVSPSTNILIQWGLSNIASVNDVLIPIIGKQV